MFSILHLITLHLYPSSTSFHLAFLELNLWRIFYKQPHVSLSTWVSHPASLSRSLRRSRLTTLPPQLLLATERHGSEICAQAGLSRFDKWHRCRRTCWASGRRNPPAVDHCRRSQPEQYDYLAGSGPQLACERWNEGSPGALDAGRKCSANHVVQGRPG